MNAKLTGDCNRVPRAFPIEIGRGPSQFQWEKPWERGWGDW